MKSGAAVTNEGLDFHSIILFLSRHALSIFASVIAALALASIYLVLAVPIYSATALVLHDPAQSSPFDPDRPIPSIVSASARLDSEVELLSSDATLVRTIEAEDLTKDAEFGSALEGTAALNDTLRKLRASLTIQRRGATYVIAVTARAQSPPRAAQIANSVVNAYLDQQLSAKIALVRDAQTILNAYLTEAENSVRAAELALSATALSPQPPLTTEAFTRDSQAPQYPAELAADVARSQYQSLLTRAQNLTSAAQLQLPDSRVISAALPPSAPSSPNTRLALLLAVILGLGVGTVMAYVHENLFGGFNSEEQLSSAFRLSGTFGTPRSRGVTSQDSVADHISEQPASAYSDAVRRLRAAIEHVAPLHTSPALARTIMVSSPRHGDGKTTTALALARSYALSGKRALLVDCDFRRPSLHSQLKIATSNAFVAHLTASTPMALEAVTAHDPLTPLTVVTATAAPHLIGDALLNSPRFRQFIALARQQYDIVIFDTAPVGTVADALYLASRVDLILLAVRCRTTPQSLVRSTMLTLHAVLGADQTCLGVLTHMPPHQASYAVSPVTYALES